MRASRSLVRILAASALAAGLVLATAGPAFAHADLASSTPAEGAVLNESPASIDLEFTEPVAVANGAIRVFDTDANRIDEGVVDVSGRVAALSLPTLDEGSYAVTFRVTSNDGHPVSGAFTFQVGSGAQPSATSRQVTKLADRLLADQGGDRIVGVAYGTARWLGFAGLALLIGGAVFALLWPGARRAIATRRVIRVGWVATAVATVVSLFVYGPYVAGLGIGDVFSTSLLGDTIDERIGQAWLARLVLLVIAVPLLALLASRDRGANDDDRPRTLPVWWIPVGVAVAVLLAATPGLSGHAISGRWTTAAVIADTLHVLAMAVWLGGVVALATITLGSSAVKATTESLARFSRIALGCIGVIAVTGTFQSVRQLGSFDAVRDTDYGRILVVKLVIVAGIVVVAAFSREVVLRMSMRSRLLDAGNQPGGAPAPAEPTEAEVTAERSALRRSVVVEIALGLAVLAATALLVNAAPGYSSTQSTSGAVGVTMEAATISVDVTVTPGISGRNDIHVDLFTPEGAPLGADELTVTFALPDGDVAPIDVPLRTLGPGHYYSPGFDVPGPGEWRIVATPVLSDGKQPTLNGRLDIG